MRTDQIVKAGVSHVPEGRQVFPGLTVIEPVALLRELKLTQPKPEPDQRPDDNVYS